MIQSKSAMETFLIDFIRIGRAERIRVPLWPEHRGNVKAGSVVLVKGDDVPDRRAKVESLSPDGRHANLHFLSDLPSAVLAAPT
jgi:hypothetical protein